MRVASGTQRLDAEPGATVQFAVDVVNTAAVIDGITARVIGLPDDVVSVHPALLPLFPKTSGRLTLSVAVPSHLAAGRHQLTVEVVSHGALEPPAYLDLDLHVAARPELSAVATPRIARTRRSAQVVVEVLNDGNVALDGAISALDADRAVRVEITPRSVRLEPGGVTAAVLRMRGPRMITGGELERTVTIEVLATPIQPHSEADTDPERLVRQVPVRLRQRPLISRGLLTALILASIVALWAAAFLLGLTKVFSGDPATKQAPASFFLAGRGSPPGDVPADALPKTGQLPPGVAGAISGAVTGGNDRGPVGRILVQAWRAGRDGPQLVSSAATGADGTYLLGGLFPTS